MSYIMSFDDNDNAIFRKYRPSKKKEDKKHRKRVRKMKKESRRRK